MTSGGLALEKLKAPLEKEKEQLQSARHAILEQLRVLKVRYHSLLACDLFARVRV